MRRTVLACALTSVAVVATAVAGALKLANPEPGESPIDFLWVTWYLGWPVVGLVLVTRRRGGLVGWLLCGIGATLGATVLLDMVVRVGGLAPESVLAGVLGVANMASGFPAFVLVALLLLTFPSGRVPRGWRIPVVFSTVCALLAMVVQVLRPGPVDANAGIVNPFGVPVLADAYEPLMHVLSLGAGALLVASIAHSVWRFLRSRGVERAQRKWFVCSILLFPLLFPIGAFAHNDTLIVLAFVVAGNGVALAIAVAVTRYRLYEIDRVVSRTVTYLAVTAVLLGIYAGAVMGLGSALRSLGGSSDLAVAASTLLVAALFSPLRRRVQRLVDRRFNRARFDAQRTVEAFRERLRGEVDPDGLEAELRHALASTLQPAQASLWLRPTAADRR